MPRRVHFTYTLEIGDDEYEIPLIADIDDPEPEVGWHGGIANVEIDTVPIGCPLSDKELDEILFTKEHMPAIDDAAFEALADYA